MLVEKSLSIKAWRNSVWDKTFIVTKTVTQTQKQQKDTSENIISKRPSSINDRKTNQPRDKLEKFQEKDRSEYFKTI